MTARGTVALAKKLEQHAFLNEERAFTRFEALSWLLLKARLAETFAKVDLVTVHIGRGELLVNIPEVADRWRWPEDRVRAFLTAGLQGAKVDVFCEMYDRSAHVTFKNFEQYNPEPEDAGDLLGGVLPKPKKKKADPRTKEVMHFMRDQLRHRGEQLFLNYAKDGGAVKRLLKTVDELRLRRLWDLFVEKPPDTWTRNKGWSIAYFSSQNVIAGLNAELQLIERRERTKYESRNQRFLQGQTPRRCDRVAPDDRAECHVYDYGTAPTDAEDPGLYCDGLGNLWYYIVPADGKGLETRFTKLRCPLCGEKGKL